jgi:hypothetical protein
LRRDQQVSLPKTNWFREQAENPLQAGLLHPSRRLPHVLRVEIKGSSDSYQNLPREVAPVRSHPLFLFWCAEPNEYQVGSAFAYDLLDVLVFCFCKRPERG